MKKLAMLSLAAAVASGCTGMQSTGDESAEIAKYRQELAARDARVASLEDELRKQRSAAETARLAAADAAAPASDLFPPDPRPGNCYARVLIPAQYETTNEKVLVRGASERVEVAPPVYEWVTERVLIEEESRELEVVPAQYEWTEERVLVKPAATKLVEVPARYETVTEKVLDKPAHTVWKRSRSPIAGALKTTVDQSTGEVMCLVEVPATYKTVSKTVQVEPATTREVEIPAEYKTVKRRVVSRPAQTREVVIPAKYETVTVQKLVKPAQEKRIQIPEEWDTITKTSKVRDDRLVWRDVVCEVNMTRGLAESLQQELRKSGHYNGPLDGVFGPQTLAAVNDYAESKGLPVGDGYIPVETIKALGLEI